MEELTNVGESVVTEVTEEVVNKISLGTALTGVCAATGAIAIVYGVYKGITWGYGKVKGSKAKKLEQEVMEHYADQEVDTDIIDEI